MLLLPDSSQWSFCARDTLWRDDAAEHRGLSWRSALHPARTEARRVRAVRQHATRSGTLASAADTQCQAAPDETVSQSSGRTSQRRRPFAHHRTQCSLRYPTKVEQSKHRGKQREQKRRNFQKKYKKRRLASQRDKEREERRQSEPVTRQHQPRGQYGRRQGRQDGASRCVPCAAGSKIYPTSKYEFTLEYDTPRQHTSWEPPDPNGPRSYYWA